MRTVRKDFIVRLASRLRLALVDNYNAIYIGHNLIAQVESLETTYLDLLDLMLAEDGTGYSYPDRLRSILETGASVWTVRTDGTGLERRVETSAVEAFQASLAPNDLGSEDLRQAWQDAFGLHANPSDAWDHSIKAVEHVLVPLVTGDPKGTLGRVIAELHQHPEHWRLTLSSTDGSSGPEPLVAMLRLLWVNPDRHGGGNHRTPTLEEAQALVHLAVTIVQWTRSGVLTRCP